MSRRSLLRRLARKSVFAQRAYRWYRRWSQATAYPDWAALLATNSTLWRKATETRQGQKVLLATSVGGLPTGVIMDSLLAVALTLRGAKVDFLLCDAILPACLMPEVGIISPREFSRRGPQALFCRSCFNVAATVFRALELRIHTYSEFVTPEEMEEALRLSAETPRDQLENLTLDGIPVGEHALAGTLRFFARSNLEGEPWAEKVMRRYISAAIISTYSVQRLLRQERYAVVSAINGIYVPQGLVAAVARRERVRVVTWSVAYRKQCFVFSHDDTYHHTLMSEPVEIWENMEWSDQHETDITEYLRSRRRGGRDWIVFQDRRPDQNLARISKQLGGVDFSKPCVAMLTNVAWDAQLHYPANAFPDMLDWVIKTVRYFGTRPDLQLIIRVHPAEISGDIPSRQPVMEEIKRHFPVLPKNVFLIPPGSRIGTYAVVEACNAVIIFGTKTGVELTSLGIPVIVAGEAWIRGKGVTTDVQSEADYFRVLDQLPYPGRMGTALIQRARRYAYHFFFRRMIPIAQMEPTGGEPQSRIKISNLSELLPGRSRGLDILCDGILAGSPFVYPAETVGVDG